MVKKENPIPTEKIADLFAYWNDGAQEDLETAQLVFFKAQRFGPSLFFLHLSLEKRLKALFVKKLGLYAPLTHNLLSLAQRCELDMTPERETLLADINEFNMATRYPSEKSRFYANASKEMVEKYLNQGIELHTWISENLKKLP